MTKQYLYKITQLLSIALLFLGFSNVQADWKYNNNSPVTIDVVDDHGQALNQYAANSRNYKNQRIYLEAKKGKRYQLRIRNNSNRRIGVVLAVDGRNILTGRKSYLRSNEKMYVLNPYESTSYKGWRTSKNHVNRFYFTSAGDSYSDAWGDHSAMGVIAVAIFDEKRHYRKHKNNSNKRMAPSKRGYLADESTGTGFGREEYSPTIKVNFKAKHQPSFKHFFKYEWRKTLCKKGIVSCGYYEDNYRENNRFWPREADNDYAPYPPHYGNYRNNSSRNIKKDWADQFTVGWGADYIRSW